MLRDIKPGHEEDYEAWVHRLLKAVDPFPGYLGTTVLGSRSQASGRGILILRFADEASTKAWETSQELAQLIKEADAFSIYSMQQAVGLEAWFTLPDTQLKALPKWKMRVALISAAYIISSIVVPIITIFIPGAPFLITRLITPSS